MMSMIYPLYMSKNTFRKNLARLCMTNKIFMKIEYLKITIRPKIKPCLHCCKNLPREGPTSQLFIEATSVHIESHRPNTKILHLF